MRRAPNEQKPLRKFKEDQAESFKEDKQQIDMEDYSNPMVNNDKPNSNINETIRNLKSPHEEEFRTLEEKKIQALKEYVVCIRDSIRPIIELDRHEEALDKLRAIGNECGAFMNIIRENCTKCSNSN